MTTYTSNLIIKNCYSTGTISGNYAGGIAGYRTSTNDPTVASNCTITNCYSRGAITGTAAGGIYGYKAAYSSGSIATANNCYSNGAITGIAAGGIFDASFNYPGQITTKCYTSNGNWLDAKADLSLNMASNAWVDINLNSNSIPYLLADFSYNMYTPSIGTNITDSNTSSLEYNSYTYSIVSVNGAAKPTGISIITNDGKILIQPDSLNSGNYNIKVLAQKKDLNKYYFSNFTYIDTNVIPCFLEGTKILCLKNGEEIYIKIEDLEKGDFIKTYKQGYLPLGVVGYTCIHNKEINDILTENLYKCTKDKYPELTEDLYLTGGHGILMNDNDFNSQTLTTAQIIQLAFKDLTCCDKSNIMHLYLREMVKKRQTCRKIDDLWCVETYKDNRAERLSIDGNYNIWNIALNSNNDDISYGIYANGLLVETASKNFMKNESGMVLKYE